MRSRRGGAMLAAMAALLWGGCVDATPLSAVAWECGTDGQCGSDFICSHGFCAVAAAFPEFDVEIDDGGDTLADTQMDTDTPPDAVDGTDLEPDSDPDSDLDAPEGTSDLADSSDIPIQGDPCFQALGVDCETFNHDALHGAPPVSGDRFGATIALFGDTLAIGAPEDASTAIGVDGIPGAGSAIRSGAVYIFTRTDDVWTQQAFIKASNASSFDQFGRAIALTNDGNRLIVGAPYESSTAIGVGGDQGDGLPLSGAVYSFIRADSSWSQDGYLKASDRVQNNQFGSSVAVDGARLIVGAPTPNAAGAVYPFAYSEGFWTPGARLASPTPDVITDFGTALALDGPTLIVGALREGSIGHGGVHIYTETDGAWAVHTPIIAPDPGDFNHFGASLALDGNRLAIGAWNSLNQADAGAVYIFERAEGPWVQQTRLTGLHIKGTDGFGWAIDLSGDRLIVGAPIDGSIATGLDGTVGDADAGLESGAAYLFTRTGEGWGATPTYIKAPGLNPGAIFGHALALDGITLLIGAPNEPEGGTVYSHRLAP